VGQRYAGWASGGGNNLQSCSHFSRKEGAPENAERRLVGCFVHVRLLDPHFCPLLANSISPATNSQQGISPHPEPASQHQQQAATLIGVSISLRV